MPYNQAWNEAAPLGSAPANTLDTIIQNVKVSLRERLEQCIPDFGDDLVEPKRIRIDTGTLVERPEVPEFPGHLYYSTDNRFLYIGAGGAWVPFESTDITVFGASGYTYDPDEATAAARKGTLKAVGQVLYLTIRGANTSGIGNFGVNLTDFNPLYDSTKVIAAFATAYDISGAARNVANNSSNLDSANDYWYFHVTDMAGADVVGSGVVVHAMLVMEAVEE